MTNSLPCPNCGHSVKSTDYMCPECSVKIITTVENLIIDNDKTITPEISDLEIGESVKISNREHPYFDEIALVCDKKHLFVRLELHGYKIWMPSEWVTKHV